MNVYEVMKDWIENKVPEWVLTKEGIENAAVVYHHYSWIHRPMMEDEPALKSFVAMTRQQVGQDAIDEITAGKVALPYPQGFVHTFITPEECDDSDQFFPPNAVMFYLLGWAVKGDQDNGSDVRGTGDGDTPVGDTP